MQPMTVDTRASLLVEPFFFRKEAWATEGDHVFPGPPGTWFDVRPYRLLTAKDGLHIPKGVLALYRCPACLGVLALHARVHRIDAKGFITPDLVCKHGTPPCSFHRRACLDQWANKPLYAVAIERQTPAGWKAEMHYCHARTEAEARFHLGHLGGVYRIAAVGPVIGYFNASPDGSIVSAD